MCIRDSHHAEIAGRKGFGGGANVAQQTGHRRTSVSVSYTHLDVYKRQADIAREMQFHRAMTPEKSRADAARALVVRELLRLEVDRLGLRDDVQDGSSEAAEEASIRLLLEREVENRVPTLDDCQRYYAQNPERFHAPDRIRVRHILLGAAAADVSGRFNAREQAEKLIAELKLQPHLFTDFALRHSDCPSKDDGGELGWLERGQATPEFDRQVFRLREGCLLYTSRCV